MAAIDFECDISEQGIADFKSALAKFQRKTQRDMATAIRIATIDLCKSLRKQTRQAAKLMPRAAFRVGRTDPQWWTRGNGQLYRRMVRKGFGKKGDLVFWQQCRQIYKQRRLKNGGMAESWTRQSEAQLIRDARARWGNIANWGFAKQTWGWVMWRLFNLSQGNEGFTNRRVKITHKHVDAKNMQKREPLPDGTIDMEAPIKCEITIINKLRYIRRALRPGALAIAVQQATKTLLYKGRNCVREHWGD